MSPSSTPPDEAELSKTGYVTPPPIPVSPGKSPINSSAPQPIENDLYGFCNGTLDISVQKERKIREALNQNMATSTLPLPVRQTNDLALLSFERGAIVGSAPPERLYYAQELSKELVRNGYTVPIELNVAEIEEYFLHVLELKLKEIATLENLKQNNP